MPHTDFDLGVKEWRTNNEIYKNFGSYTSLVFSHAEDMYLIKVE